MAVYVDNARIPYGRKLMCHMVADTREELHAMARRIGVRKRWFQANASFPHYDVCFAKRELAVKSGAVELERREMGQLVRRMKHEGRPRQTTQTTETAPLEDEK